MTLSNRERFILHSMSVIVVDILIKKFHKERHAFRDTLPLSTGQLNKAMDDVRTGRCRKMTVDNMAELYDEMKEEMLLGSEVHKDNI